jgi:ubiquinone/menaquinone biosynthesis C-methylase UbiE
MRGKMDLFGFSKEVDIRPYLIRGTEYWNIVNDRYFEKRGPEAFRQDFWTFDNEPVFARAEAEMFAKKVRLDGKANYLGLGVGDCTFYKNFIKFLDPKTYEKTTFWLVDSSDSLIRNAKSKLKKEIGEGRVKVLKGSASELPKEIPKNSVSFMRGNMVLERLEKDFVYKSNGAVHRTKYLPVVNDKLIPSTRFVEMAEDGLDPHQIQFFRVMIRPAKLFTAYLYSYGLRDNELAEEVEYVIDVGSTRAVEEANRVLADGGTALFYDFFAGLNGMRCRNFTTVRGGDSFHFLSSNSMQRKSDSRTQTSVLSMITFQD